MKRALLLLAITACAEPAIEMKLVMPSSDAPFDMSCVTAVDLLPIPVGDAKPLDIGYREEGDMEKVPCVDLASPVHTFAELEAAIKGRFDLPLPPEGLAGIEIRGRAGACDEMPAYHEAVFYGGATVHDGQDTVSIPLAHNLSCDATVTYTVRPVDLVSLVQTKQCAAVTDSGQLFTGVVRPTMLDDMIPIIFEAGPSYHSLAAGVGPLSTYKSSWQGACPAVAWDGANGYNQSCITVGAPTACAQAGEVELPLVGGDYVSNSIDRQLMTKYAGAVIGAVWSTAGTAGPVTGATITLDANSDAQLIYGDVGTTQFTANASATTTGASGMFVVYTNKLTGLTVSAPGKASRHVWLGADDQLPGTALVVLN